MRIAAVGDVHGAVHLEAFQKELATLGPVDLFLLAGDTTERNDIDGFGTVAQALRDCVDSRILAVFGNNEYGQDHPTYVARFADEFGIRFLDDEAAEFEAGGTRIRVIGSTGSLDRPTWWQRKNLPRIAEEYRRRIDALDRLLAGSDVRILLTHYPPTYATMGAEKEEWRPELGCRALEPILLRRRPTLVVHGHIHKGIPYAELRGTLGRLEDFGRANAPIPVHNVAFPVRKRISTFDL